MEEQILVAAEKLFLEQGFAKTSTARIAQQAGCNTALIHYYYRTKGKLFEKIFKQKIRQLVESLTVIPLADLTFEQKIEQIVTTHFDFICRNPRLPFLLFNEINTNPEAAVVLRAEFERASGSLLVMVQRELDANLGEGQMQAVDLMINIISLNVMATMMLPVVQNFAMSDFDQFTARRRKVIVETIIKSLRYE